jgi:hypothetical protein
VQLVLTLAWIKIPFILLALVLVIKKEINNPLVLAIEREIRATSRFCVSPELEKNFTKSKAYFIMCQNLE